MDSRIDSLRHFIKNSANKTAVLEEISQEFIAKSIKGKNALLIIDDTPCPRKGPKIEGTGIHYGASGLVRGFAQLQR